MREDKNILKDTKRRKKNKGYVGVFMRKETAYSCLTLFDSRKRIFDWIEN
jgi:hypothetical protein